MTKIRKQKRKKTYRHSSNRQRVNKRMRKLPNIKCPEVKEEWREGWSAKQNMEEMGLVYDLNSAFRIPTTKEILKGEERSSAEGAQVRPRRKQHVAEKLEQDANLPRERLLRLPDGQARWLAYLIHKYGEDYKGMARDDHNYYQETWKQLKNKIKLFKSIPGQLEEFMKTE
ncbi:nucleolar protein 16 [Ischnura elegans]|uniref:nucleolar protein 16 n=1 Tax=Ischnura elegans TaxID=197161 RepID=UPI001ED89892|nr:nucleolar protein 16 [Ischnura elegans]